MKKSRKKFSQSLFNAYEVSLRNMLDVKFLNDVSKAFVLPMLYYLFSCSPLGGLLSSSESTYSDKGNAVTISFYSQPR